MTPTIAARSPSAVPLLVAPRAPTLPALRVVRQSHGPSRIAGIVRHIDGTPAADAVITYFALPSQDSSDEDEDSRAPSSTTTDPGGAFSFDVGPGDYGLYASDATRSSTVLSPVSVSPGEAVTELALVLDGASVVSGVVVDGTGAPLRARLSVSMLSPHVRLGGVRSDLQGHFRAAHLPNAPLEVIAFARELQGRRKLAHPEEDVVIRLGTLPGALVCEVNDSSGHPVAAADLWATFANGGTFTHTDANGSARLAGLSGRVSINVRSPSAAAAPVEVEIDGSEQHVRILMDRAAMVKGRVLDHVGRPAGGQVTLEDDRGVARSALLDEGAYAFDAVRAGNYTLGYNAASVPDASVSVAFSTNGRDDFTVGDLELPAPRTIRGRVLDDRGEPVAAAELDVVSLVDGTFGDLDVQTDDDGRFEIAVVGKTRLRANYDGDTTAPLLLAGTGDEDVTLVLESVGQLEGLVRGASQKAEVRCADGVWHPLGATGQYQLSCTATATIEVRDAGTTRSFAVDFDPDETSYAEIRWSLP